MFSCVIKELASALVDRDRAICEKNELLEKYCHEVKDKAEAQKELSQACKDIEMVREERDVARKERTEAIIQRDQLLREYYQARQVARQTGDLSLQVEGLIYSSDNNPFIPSHIVVNAFFSPAAGGFPHIDLLKNVQITSHTMFHCDCQINCDESAEVLALGNYQQLQRKGFLTKRCTRKLHCIRNG